MPKLFIRSLSAGIVLLAGLISCSPEKKTTDVYQSPPPRIHGAHGTMDFREWDLLNSKQFELQDSLDFSSIRPARLTIKTQCRSGNEKFYGNFAFSAETDIQFWRVMPDEVLSEDLSKKNFTCGFEMNLFNDAGSNHIFTLASEPVLENSTPSAQIAHEPSSNTTALLRLTPQTAQDVRLRYANSAAASAQIFCRDAVLNPMPFEQVMDFGHFNFASSTAKTGRAPDILQTQPVQSCRAVIFEKGRRAAYSSLFHITLVPSQVLVTEVPSPSLIQIPSLKIVQLLADLMSGNPLLVETWRLHNGEKYGRYFRFNKALHKGIAQFYHFPPSQVVANRETYLIRALELLPAPTPSMRILEDSVAVIVHLPPGGDLDVTARFRAPRPMSCHGEIDFTAASLNGFEPATFDEVTLDGTILTTVSLQPKDIGLVNERLTALPKALDINNHCDWN